MARIAARAAHSLKGMPRGITVLASAAGAWLATGAVARAAEAAVEGTNATTGAFPPFESSGFASQLFWLAITFGGLYWFLLTRAVPRVEKALGARAEVIEGGRTEARRLREEAEAAEAAYEQELATARRDAGSIASKARDEANREAADARAKAEADLDARLKESEAKVAETKRAALAHVDEIATDVAAALMGRIDGVNATRDEIGAAIRSEAERRGTVA